MASNTIAAARFFVVCCASPVIWVFVPRITDKAGKGPELTDVSCQKYQAGVRQDRFCINCISAPKLTGLVGIACGWNMHPHSVFFSDHSNG